MQYKAAVTGGEHTSLVPEESTTPDLVALTRSGFDANKRRDVDSVVSFYAREGVVDAQALGTFVGRAAIRDFYHHMVVAFDHAVSEPDEICDLGNGVVLVVACLNARPVGSAGSVQQRFVVVNECADGLIVRATFYNEVEDGRAAAERLAEERA
jgi:ketosteroid isomerase-like protein